MSKIEMAHSAIGPATQPLSHLNCGTVFKIYEGDDSVYISSGDVGTGHIQICDLTSGEIIKVADSVRVIVPARVRLSIDWYGGLYHTKKS